MCGLLVCLIRGDRLTAPENELGQQRMQISLHPPIGSLERVGRAALRARALGAAAVLLLGHLTIVPHADISEKAVRPMGWSGTAPAGCGVIAFGLAGVQRTAWPSPCRWRRGLAGVLGLTRS